MIYEVLDRITSSMFHKVTLRLRCTNYSVTFRFSMKVKCYQYQIWFDTNTAYVLASLFLDVRGISITYHQAMLWFSQSYEHKKY